MSLYYANLRKDVLYVPWTNNMQIKTRKPFRTMQGKTRDPTWHNNHRYAEWYGGFERKTLLAFSCELHPGVGHGAIKHRKLFMDLMY